MNKNNPLEFSKDLIIFNGGLLDRLLTRFGLGGSSTRQIFKKILLWICISWLPLSILAMIAIISGAPPPEISFFDDFSFHLRFLIALPIVLGAEHHVQNHIRDVIQVFFRRRILEVESSPLIEKALEVIRTLRNSAFIEIIILLLAIRFSSNRALLTLPSEMTSWRTMETAASLVAHTWYQWISLVVYHFFFLRWVWKYLLWCGVLLRLATLKLRLESHHPDQVGGLSFLVYRHMHFSVVVSGFSIVASANVAALVLYGHRSVDSFQSTLIAYIVIVSLILVGPLLMFTPHLVKAKREGLLLYGNFSAIFTQLFTTKWYNLTSKMDQSILAHSDFSSLHDLEGSYFNLREMKSILISRKLLIALMIPIGLPFTPLILFKIPLIEILKRLTTNFI